MSDAATAVLRSSQGVDDLYRALALRLDVTAQGPDFGELTRRAGARTLGGTLDLPDLTGLSSADEVVDAYLRESFVIDYSEAGLEEPTRQLTDRYGKPTADDIVDFVSGYIREKSTTHNFDIASRVAHSRAGDCSEHAVLTTALARRFGHPARVVFGIALVGIDAPSEKPVILGLGHAWSEIFDGARWTIADAALRTPQAGVSGLGVPEGSRVLVVHVPLGLLSDESPSFRRSMLDTDGLLQVQTIRIDARR